MNTKYSPEELTVLKSSFSSSVVARLLGRTVHAVQQKRYDLAHPGTSAERSRRSNARTYALNQESLKTADEHRQPWTDTDEYYVTSTMKQKASEVAATLGRSVRAVERRRQLLANA
jgi:hypothetical protein